MPQKQTLEERIIARLLDLCEKAEARGRRVMIISRKDLMEIFGNRPEDLKVIVHGTDGGGAQFVRVSREYLEDRLQKRRSPAFATLQAVPPKPELKSEDKPGSQ